VILRSGADHKLADSGTCIVSAQSRFVRGKAFKQRRRGMSVAMSRRRRSADGSVSAAGTANGSMATTTDWRWLVR
jgi:hypothetical protein